MKKLIAILVVFALIAGTAFAQVNVSGKLELGTMMVMDSDEPPSNRPIPPNSAVIGAGLADNDYQFGAEANITVAYDFGTGASVKLGVGLDGAVEFGLTYYGDNFSFAFGNRLFDSWNGTDAWGKFNFINNQLEVTTAIKGPWSQDFRSDNAVDIGDGWESFCCRSGARVKFAPNAVNGLSFALVFPSTNFTNDGDTDFPWGGGYGALANDVWSLKDFILSSLAAFKFARGGFSAALMSHFTLESYLGVSYNFASGLSLGVSFWGQFLDDAEMFDNLSVNPKARVGGNPILFRAGGTLGYSNDYFSVNIPIIFGNMPASIAIYYGGIAWSGESIGVAGSGEASIIAKPKFQYNAILSSVAVQLETGLGVNINNPGQNLVWMVRPGIFWNTQGTGATTDRDSHGGNGLKNGIIVEFEVFGAGADIRGNSLNFAFRYSF